MPSKGIKLMCTPYSTEFVQLDIYNCQQKIIWNQFQIQIAQKKIKIDNDNTEKKTD